VRDCLSGEGTRLRHGLGILGACPTQVNASGACLVRYGAGSDSAFHERGCDFGRANDRPIPCWARLALVAGEQVLQDRVDAFVLYGVEFGVFVEGDVLGSANFFHCADHTNGVAFQGLEFFAHYFSGGGGFYDVDDGEQRYFRTALWITC
jgi:hypothetical protein